MIRLFISSTFQDMNTERDLIHTEIYPKLREYGMKKGIYVEICDLRFGIKTDDGENKKDELADIMKVCFREVSNCKPYIVSIIGDRYGTTPENTEQIIAAWNEACDSKYEIPENHSEISLTQWELEFSVLSEQNDDVRALCLFREDKPVNNEKINNLKQRILKKSAESGNRIVSERYIDNDEFKTVFIENIKRFIDQEAQNGAANWVEENQLFIDAYTSGKSNGFIGREEEVRAFEEFVSSESETVLGYYGESGIGKSTLLSYLFRKIRTERKSFYLPCGNAFRCNSYLDIVKQLIYFVQTTISSEPVNVRDDILLEEEAEEVLEEMLHNNSDNCDLSDLIIFIDAMDKLQIELNNNLLRIFLSNKVKIVCSQIEAFESAGSPGAIIRHLGSMSKDDAIQFLGKNLYKNIISEYDSEPLITAIVDKNDALSPLYLSTVITILKMHMGDKIKNKDEVESYLTRVQRLPADSYKLCWDAILEAAEYVSSSSKSNVNKSNLILASGLIAISRHGLREHDLERILKDQEWRTVDFANFRSYLAHFFRQQADGCWIFEHDIIRNGIIQNYNYDNQTIDNLTDYLYKYVLDDDLSDLEVKIREGLYLSAKKGNCVLSLHLFEMLEGSEYSIRTVAAKELAGIIHEDIDDIWIRMVVRSDIIPVIELMSTLLELISTDDFDRRYPAMICTEKFLQISGLTTKERIDRWVQTHTFREQFALADLLSEYVSMHESLGTMWKAAEFIRFPVEFFTNKDNIDRIKNDSNREFSNTAFIHLNTLLYSNNIFLEQLKGLSQTIIHSYSKDHYNLNDKHLIRGIYINNIGQYYNTLENYSEALSFYSRSLLAKVEKLFELLDIPNSPKLELFTQMYAEALQQHPVVIDDSIINQALAFWKSVEEDIFEYYEDLAKSSTIERYTSWEISDAWMRIATSYRSLGMIINDITNNATTEPGIIKVGMECMRISIEMLSSHIAASAKKEKLISIVRALEIADKFDENNLDEELRKLLISWSSEAVRYYLDNARFIGRDEGNKLKAALEKTKKRASDPKQEADLCEEIAKLSELLAV